MKRTTTALWMALLLAASMPVGVQGQTALPEVEIFSESDEDLETSDGVTSQRYSAADLAGLYIQESADDITFRIQVRQVTSDDDVTFVERAFHEFVFQLGYETQTVETDDDGSTTEAIPQYLIQVEINDGDAYGYLAQYDPARDRFVQIGRFTDEHLRIDASTQSVLVTVPREYLLDFNGAQVSPGLPLHDFIIYGYGGFGGEARDVMPDSGEPEGEYVPQLGIQQTGHIRLSSPAPVRSSNGEATTYVFDILLESNGDFIDDVDLELVGVPGNWEVKLPADSLRVENGTQIHLPVLVTIPFGHKHGEFVNFVLEAHSNRDRSAVGRIELGVRFTTIPQPAGHHSTLWLHSSEHPVNSLQGGFNTVAGGSNGPEGGVYAYFNAAEGQDDERDLEMDVPPDSSITQGDCGEDDGSQPTCVTYGWTIYLEPSLQLGLDFDVNGTGELAFPVRSPIAMQDAVLQGFLFYERAEDASRNEFDEDDCCPTPEDYEQYNSSFDEDDPNMLVLGTFTATEPDNLGGGQIHEFVTTFTPTEASDFILYEPSGASMWMEIYVTALGSEAFFAEGAKQPELVPGGQMTLPLEEYHDPVDDLYNQLTDVEIIMESPQEQYVNSGEVILYELRIENTGVVNDQFTINLTGHNQDWGRILGDTTFSVRSHESRRIVVAVQAPFESVQGETADLVLEAVSESDDNARALVRLYAEVDNLVDHDDKSHLVPFTTEELTRTPIGPWLAPMALLAVLLARRRWSSR